MPNGSFEILDTCPYLDAQVHFAKPWFQPCTNPILSSSDLFNACATSPFFQVPNNTSFAGYQYAQHGVGYSGMALWNSDNQRELIEVKLTDTLEFGIEYCIEFYVSSIGGTGTDCIHLGFSPDSLRTNNGFLLAGVVPAISADTIITDTLNWSRIYGTYVANGDEIFIVIGNLLDNSFCQIDDASLGGSYYYVDNVSIYKCSDTLNQPDSNDVVIPNVFSPNNDSKNDIFRILGANGNTHMEIYNRWGEKIYFADGNNCYWDGWTNVGVQCPDGTYFYIITIEEKTYKGYVHLLR